MNASLRWKLAFIEKRETNTHEEVSLDEVKLPTGVQWEQLEKLFQQNKKLWASIVARQLALAAAS